jgi:hypothetical protein
MANVVKLVRKPKPLKESYNSKQPYVVEREDEEDGSIRYSVWDYRPDSYRFVCAVSDEFYEDGDGGYGNPYAKHDAEHIARGLNLLVQYGIEKLPKIRELD